MVSLKGFQIEAGVYVKGIFAATGLALGMHNAVLISFQPCWKALYARDSFPRAAFHTVTNQLSGRFRLLVFRFQRRPVIP